MLYGDVDQHDGSGPLSALTEIIMSVPDPQTMGSYQMKVFEITAAPEVMQQDAATIAEIFPNYSLNTRYVNAVAMQGIQDIMAQQRASTAYFNQQMASTDLMSQGMSDLLRGESVFTDNDTAGVIAARTTWPARFRTQIRIAFRPYRSASTSRA